VRNVTSCALDRLASARAKKPSGKFGLSAATTVIIATKSAARNAAKTAANKYGVRQKRIRSGLYADITGEGSVIAAKMAIEDFKPAGKGIKVDVVSADHQNKSDVGVNKAREWYDQDGVDAIFDVPNSGVALAVSAITQEKNKVFINSGAATSDLTGANGEAIWLRSCADCHR
jgi:branched-chain amino acid transport system substrate-binding protein